MTWVGLSFNEWRRRPLRTSVTAAGVAIAAACVFSLCSFQQGYREGVRRELDRLGAHILLAPKGCPYDAASMALHGASWPCYLKEGYLAEVRSVPGVAVAAPVLMSVAYDQKTNQVVYLGVDTNILPLRIGWKISGTFPTQEKQVLVGAEAAQRFGWRIGDTVRLPGVAGQTGTVGGILGRKYDAEDTFIFPRLADAQRLFKHPGEVSHILVQLTEPDELERAVAQLRGCDAGLLMNVVPLTHIFHTIQSIVNSTRLLLGCIALAACLVAAGGVSNAVFMALVERTREIGVMRALGSSRRQIFLLVWSESLQVCLAGATSGVVLAWLGSGCIENFARSRLSFAPIGPLLGWDWPLATAVVAGACVLGTFAAFLPAWRASSLNPINAIRSGNQ